METIGGRDSFIVKLKEKQIKKKHKEGKKNKQTWVIDRAVFLGLCKEQGQ